MIATRFLVFPLFGIYVFHVRIEKFHIVGGYLSRCCELSCDAGRQG